MLIRVDDRTPKPLRDQIVDGLRAAIVDGRVAVGEQLPTARSLSATLGVNEQTVLRAYRVIRDDGLIELRQGRGAIVSGRPGRHAALAGAVHDLVDEAKLNDIPEAVLLALISQAYR